MSKKVAEVLAAEYHELEAGMALKEKCDAFLKAQAAAILQEYAHGVLGLEVAPERARACSGATAINKERKDNER